MAARQYFLVDSPKQWQRFESVSKAYEIPVPLHQLFSVFFDDLQRISSANYCDVLANISMVEAGFVPVLEADSEANLSATDLMSESYEKRMKRLIDVLIVIAKKRGTLSVVEYAFVVPIHPDDNTMDSSFDERQEQYEYGAHRLKLITWLVGDAYTAYCNSRSFTPVFQLAKVSSYGPSTDRWRQMNFTAIFSQFKCQEFVVGFKHLICGQLIDHLSCVPQETIGFTKLPNETILHYAQFLDMRSFVRLIMTSWRLKCLLDTEEQWKKLLGSIKTDLYAYGLAVPSDFEINNVQGSSSKEKYKKLYEEAVSVTIKRNEARAFFRSVLAEFE